MVLTWFLQHPQTDVAPLCPKTFVFRIDFSLLAAAQVTLFIGNLTDEWQDVERLKTDLSQHGRVERAFIAYNAQGETKVH